MKFRSILALVATVAFTSLANAAITDINCYNDGDDAILMNSWDWQFDAGTQNTAATVNLDETLRSFPAHALADITTDTPDDPIVTFWKEVENDTTFAWSDYHITIIRRFNQPFSFVSALQPAGWDAPVINGPVLVGSYFVDGVDVGPAYVGTVDYFAGTGPLVSIGGSGLFNVKVSFLGTANFILEQVPTPEPTGLLVLAMGGMMLLARRSA